MLKDPVIILVFRLFQKKKKVSYAAFYEAALMMRFYARYGCVHDKGQVLQFSVDGGT